MAGEKSVETARGRLQRAAFDALRAAVRGLEDAVDRYEASGDHAPHNSAEADCVYCKLLGAVDVAALSAVLR